MKTLYFEDVPSITRFTNEISKFPYYIDIVCGRYVADAKSLLCIINFQKDGEILIKYPDYEDGLEEILKKYEKDI